MGVSDSLLASPMLPFCVSFGGCAEGDVGLRSFTASFLFERGPVRLVLACADLIA